jgi:hypothetical protein
MDGTGDYATVTGIDIANKSFSTSFWAKRADDSRGYIIGHSNSGSRKELGLGFHDNNSFRQKFNSDDQEITSDLIIKQSTDWIHFVTTYDAVNNIQTIYANKGVNSLVKISRVLVPSRSVATRIILIASTV